MTLVSSFSAELGWSGRKVRAGELVGEVSQDNCKKFGCQGEERKEAGALV